LNDNLARCHPNPNPGEITQGGGFALTQLILAGNRPDLRGKNKNRAGVIEPKKKEHEGAQSAIDRGGCLRVLQIDPESPFRNLEQNRRAAGTDEETAAVERFRWRKPVQEQKESERRSQADKPTYEHDFRMKVFFKPEVLEKAMHQVDDVHHADDREEQQWCAEHHHDFHELAANQSAMLAPSEDAIEDESNGPEGCAAGKQKRNESEESQHASPGDNVRDKCIEEVARMRNEVERDSADPGERRIRLHRSVAQRGYRQ